MHITKRGIKKYIVMIDKKASYRTEEKCHSNSSHPLWESGKKWQQRKSNMFSDEDLSQCSSSASEFQLP